MTLKDKNQRTDQAWNRLYSRLEQDGLLTDKEITRQSIFGSVALKWVASFVIIVSATLFLIKGIHPSKIEMLTLFNNEEASTYVSTLEDGSVVYLSGNTSLTYPRHFQKHKREVFLKGDAFFEVSKNAKAPFIIETGQLKIEVLGTSFNVKSSDLSSPSLSVNSGVVRVTLKKDGQSARLTAGETVLIHSDYLQTIKTSDIDQFNRIKSRMHFKDERLSDVLRVINRNLNEVQLEVDPSIEKRSLTATFSNNSPDSLAQMICIALNLKYSQRQNIIRIHE